MLQLMSKCTHFVIMMAETFICIDGNCFRIEVIKAMWKSLSVPAIELQGLQEVVGMLEERKALMLG